METEKSSSEIQKESAKLNGREIAYNKTPSMPSSDH